MLNLNKLIKEAKNGNLKSKQKLAFQYWSGINIKQNYKLAMKLWKEVANHKEPIGSYNVAVMYYKGYGVKQSYKKSFKYYTQCVSSVKKKYLACNKKNALGFIRESHYQIGEKMYFSGQFKKNNFLGIKHFEKAFKYGHFHAAYLLGLFHDVYKPDFYEIKKNKNKAIKYYKLASKYNYFPALAQLSINYANSILYKNNKIGFNHNFKLFKFYHKKAKRIKNKIIQTKLGLEEKQNLINEIQIEYKKCFDEVNDYIKKNKQKNFDSKNY